MVAMSRFLRHGAVVLLMAGRAAALLSPLDLQLRFSQSQRTHTLPQEIISKQLAEKGSHIKAYNFSVPIDHFHNDSRYEPHSDGTFHLRYYLDTSYYKPGGPVIVLASGEDDGTDRIPFLEDGIAHILAKETGGIGLILEHRYYGTSQPAENLETVNMRFLSTEQALADAAYFAQNVKFPGLEDRDLTAKSTPWIIYGGSYAGAFAAFARKLYPDVFWGAIASSGVTLAIEDSWQYWEAARLYAPGECGLVTQELTEVIDRVLFGETKQDVKVLKDCFGLEELDDDYAFARVLSMGISGLQNTNWDPEVDGGFGFGTYCASVNSESLLYPSAAIHEPVIKRLIDQNGLTDLGDKWVYRMLNYIGWVRATVKSACRGVPVTTCFGPPPRDTSFAVSNFRSWIYQVCTQWGYFQTGSGTPLDQLSVVSRKIDLAASSEVCRTLFNITTRPDVESINKLGGAEFSYPRVAFINGKQDPWLLATPHARLQDHYSLYWSSDSDRNSTDSEPAHLIDPGVHHWDENGINFEKRPKPWLRPRYIRRAQRFIVDFVTEWVGEWHKEKSKMNEPKQDEERQGNDELELREDLK